MGVGLSEQNRAVKEILGIPAGMELVALLPMGYRRDEKGRRGTPRKPLSEIAHKERFGIAYEPS